jgi:5'-3' exonuclease
MATIHVAAPILFIDLSYYVFYRYYALLNWYKLSQQPLDTNDIANNPVFLAKFEKMFVDNIGKLKRRIGVADANIIFARDCIRDSIWRKALFPNYKGTRGDKSRDFNGYVFIYTYDVILPRLIARCHHHLIGCDNAEADDVIGILKFKIRAQAPDAQIYIITNDMDYLQLADDKTFIQNLRTIDLVQKGQGNPQIDMMVKIIGGDSSDNIPGVFPRLSKKQVLAYAMDAEELEKAFERTPDARSRFELNKTLVDIRQVPLPIQEKIEDLISIV